VKELHRQTKATSIPAAVKQAVWERDGGRCILCGKQGNPWCHYISRAQGGLGIEQNIVTLCDKCHRRFDQSADRAALKDALANYLRSKYLGWDEKNLIYRKEF
jgi:5-methylcytosine-specific restriction endonuclease McrA